MKVAVVGAGIFGCTAALFLAREHEVDLFERHPGILHGASRANCGRIHRGYHYPRSEPTARASMQSDFSTVYYGATRSDGEHLYTIADGGRTSLADYVAFLDRLKLPYTRTGATFRVPEAILDVVVLRHILLRRLGQAGVRLHLDTPGAPDMPGYDLTVLATYGAHSPRPLQYEVTEVAVVRLGREWNGRSHVVLDGPFCCVDPHPASGLHLLYDVEHSVHQRTVGAHPGTDLPIDQGIVRTSRTAFPAMADKAREYLGIDPEHVGSLFTVRAVLPDVDDTDARPTLVERDGSTVTILGGKIDTAVTAARQLVEIGNQCHPSYL